MSTSTLPPHPVESPVPATLPPPAPAWKNEVTERLRAHRTRRPRVPENQPALPGMETAPNAETASGRAGWSPRRSETSSADAAESIAARVAARYSRVPSYRDMLAAQAAAKAAAEAEAASAAQPLFQDELAARNPEQDEAPRMVDPEPQPWQPDLIRYSVSTDSLPAPRTTPAEARVRGRQDLGLCAAASEVFDPMEEALIEPTHPLPARVIEFPRELIAPRKARPRLAEGPLREDAPPQSAPSGAQSGAQLPGLFPESEHLCIREAEPETASRRMQELMQSASSVPEWQSIHLDTEKPMPISPAVSPSSPLDGIHLPVASLQDRVMAAIVDVGLTVAAFLAFVLVFAVCTTHFPSGRVAVAGAVLILVAMWVLYQFVFFGLSDATPGMRYAKIALCTFDNENPTQPALRGRIAALMLSALPLGLGFLWALFDEESLGWHDRITQTFQRSYRGY